MKKPIKKAQTGTKIDKTSTKKPVFKKQELAQKPTYKNLGMSVDIDERYNPSRGSRVPTKQDSTEYASGFQKGLKRKGVDVFEGNVGRSGRWEGEGTSKKFISPKGITKQKARSGGKINKKK